MVSDPKRLFVPSTQRAHAMLDPCPHFRRSGGWFDRPLSALGDTSLFSPEDVKTPVMILRQEESFSDHTTAIPTAYLLPSCLGGWQEALQQANKLIGKGGEALVVSGMLTEGDILYHLRRELSCPLGILATPHDMAILSPSPSPQWLDPLRLWMEILAGVFAAGADFVVADPPPEIFLDPLFPLNEGVPLAVISSYQ